MPVANKGDNVDKWAMRTSATVDTAVDKASLAHAGTYNTTTYMIATRIDGCDFIDIAMKCTVPDAAISGDLTFSWLLTSCDTWPKQASFTSKMTPTRNITADRANQMFDVRGYKQLKLLSIYNGSGQTLTDINAEIVGKG